MKLYLAADHNGYYLKEKIEDYLRERGYEVIDSGDKVLDPQDDFPLFAEKAVNAMLSSEKESRAILVCGSGQGMMIAANRFPGVRAGLGWSKEAARSIRHDEDSNVLALPAEVLTRDTYWQEIIDTWLRTPYANAERFNRRNRQLDELGK
jgi:ribose 5-phosphate isomerase B